MTRTLDGAIAACRREVIEPQQDWSGWCLKFCRTMWGVPAGAPSAIVHWRSLDSDDRKVGESPKGALLHWAVGKHGHIAISLGSGWCVSTDIRRPGKPDAIPTALVTRRWDAKLLGWTWTLNGVDLS